MPDEEGKPTPREQLAIDRELAQAKSDASFEQLMDSYPPGHEIRRETFIRQESEKLEIELEKKQLQAIPEPDRRDRRWK